MPAQRKFLFALFITSAIFLFSPGEIFAALSLTFSEAPSSIDEETPFEIDVSLVSAPANRTYYLRAAFHEEGKTQYFGYTFNDEGNWHNSPGEYTKFLQITTNEEGSWSGKLKAKADIADSDFKGAGNYLFKIGRYTEGGSLSWSNNSTTITINIQLTPTPTPSPTPTPTPKSSTPTPTKKPTPMPTKMPTSKPSPTPSPTGKILATAVSLVLGEEATPSGVTISGEITEEPEATPPAKQNFLPKILLVLAGIAILAMAVSLFLIQKRQRDKITP